MAALKLRLNDANKVVLKGYLVLLGTLMQTMGKELKVYRYIFDLVKRYWLRLSKI